MQIRILLDVKLKCKKAKNDTTSRQIYTVPYRYLIFCKLLHPKSCKSHPNIFYYKTWIRNRINDAVRTGTGSASLLKKEKTVSPLLAKCVDCVGDDPAGGAGGAAHHEGSVPGSGQGQD